MSQQQYVTMPNGSEWEFDEWDFQYHCLHANVEIGTTEVDTFNPVHGHDTYEVPVADCLDCGEDITENYDFNNEEDEYDPDDGR